MTLKRLREVLSEVEASRRERIKLLVELCTTIGNVLREDAPDATPIVARARKATLGIGELDRAMKAARHAYERALEPFETALEEGKLEEDVAGLADRLLAAARERDRLDLASAGREAIDGRPPGTKFARVVDQLDGRLRTALSRSIAVNDARRAALPPGHAGSGQAWWWTTRIDCDESLLARKIEGSISPDDERRLEQHLRQCDTCRKEIEASGALVAALRKVDRGSRIGVRANKLKDAGTTPEGGRNTVSYDKVLNMARLALQGEETPTADKIRSTVSGVMVLLKIKDGEVDAEALGRDLESRFAIVIGDFRALEDQEDHVAWLPAKQTTIDWKYWRRYRQFLEEEVKLAPKSMDKLHEVTDCILSTLEDPERDGAWDRRGMAVGQVQSGKTSTYIGLMAKAADAGYKLIIVLAGLHNNLRSQTQMRIDEGFIGIDTRKIDLVDTKKHKARIGVGALAGLKKEDRVTPQHLTTSLDNGDFNKTLATGFGINIGGEGEPTVLVIKKNARILKNLIAWLSSQAEHDQQGRALIRGVPLLLIDDEADNASVNTYPVSDGDGKLLEPSEYDITAINKSIRALLHLFEKKGYVGYTATPFANIFIHPGESDPEVGPGLFPRSFLVNIPAPSNYVGPVEVFGLQDELGDQPRDPLPIVRILPPEEESDGEEDEEGADEDEIPSEEEEWMPQGHKKEHVPGPMPSSLKTAIRSFVLACAARMARGDAKEHNSMLVHVTRFTAVQKLVADQVGAELKEIQDRLEVGDGDAGSIVEEIEELWKSDFVPTSKKITRADLTPVTWRKVKANLLAAAKRIVVKIINGTAKDVLEYKEYRKQGLYAIAVGGDKLSRGLTLEGLSVSYYLRATRMYDTLMQMGRWFGYRPGYLDLCRLFTTADLVYWYEHITLANEELRREFDQMWAVGATPSEFGLRIRGHSGSLIVTSTQKMRSSTRMSLSYNGDISETVAFHGDRKVVENNRRQVEALFKSAGKPASRDDGRFVWSNVPGSTVCDFLGNYRTHPNSARANSLLLAKYIKAQVGIGELTDWTVVLVSNTEEKTNGSTIAGRPVRLIKRKLTPYDAGKWFSIKRLLSPKDEAIDLTPAQRVAALAATVAAWKEDTAAGRGRWRDKVNPPTEPGGRFIRRQRSASNGLLLVYPLLCEERPEFEPLIGLGISFPGSDNAVEVDYFVNEIYAQQGLGDE